MVVVLACETTYSTERERDLLKKIVTENDSTCQRNDQERTKNEVDRPEDRRWRRCRIPFFIALAWMVGVCIGVAAGESKRPPCVVVNVIVMSSARERKPASGGARDPFGHKAAAAMRKIKAAKRVVQ